MLKIIKVNCPEKTIFKNKLMKLLNKIEPNEKVILTFIIDYDVKQLNLINQCLKEYNETFNKKYKLIEFNINDSASNRCGRRECLALGLSNISSFRNSVKLVQTIEDLIKMYEIYQTKTNLKIKKENW